MDRRTFLQSTSALSAGFLAPSFLSATTRNLLLNPEERKLVVIHLQGGNDGLNTIIPFVQDQYYNLRPELAIKQSALLKFSDGLGFNPALAKMQELFLQGHLGIFQGVGYPMPDRSHFRSTEIWQTADPLSTNLSDGWIGRWLEHEKQLPYAAMEVDEQLSLALRNGSGGGMAISNPARLAKIVKDPLFQKINAQNHGHTHDLPNYLRMTLHQSLEGASAISSAFQKGKNVATYPNGKLSQRLSKIGKLISGGSATRIYYLHMAGFDTHVGQAAAHSKLLTELSDSLNAFVQDLKAQDKWNSTLVMVFSEFGRRVEENAGKGTDHGTAGPVLLLSGALAKAGVYNDHPSLSDLEEGDLKYTMDFRNIYATILDEWMHSSPSALIKSNPTNWNLFF
jgi:uncharacterized protein (DUF1501 family)